MEEIDLLKQSEDKSIQQIQDNKNKSMEHLQASYDNGKNIQEADADSIHVMTRRPRTERW